MDETTPQITPGSIVVAVDGSSHADRAIDYAAELATLEKRPLVALHAATPLIGYGAELYYPVYRTEALRGAQALVDAAADRVRDVAGTVEVSGYPLIGDARQALLDASAVASAIVIGSRGRGVVRTMLLGSVSTTVSKNADCPVFVCRPPSEETAGERPGVLVGADATAESRPVLEFAFRQASLRSLPITVMHCYWPSQGFHDAERLEEERRQEARLALAESLGGFREDYPDVPVATRLDQGFVDQVLTRRELRPDLIVVGRHPTGSLSRLFTGSTATAVLERARATVAVVPEDDFS